MPAGTIAQGDRGATDAAAGADPAPSCGLCRDESGFRLRVPLRRDKSPADHAVTRASEGERARRSLFNALFEWESNPKIFRNFSKRLSAVADPDWL